MQAVIFAAGKGTRMGSETVPKPMRTVAGKSLLEHKLDAMPEEVDEVILIIGHLGHVIRSHFGDEYNGRRIRYVEQEALNGTAAALHLAKDILNGRFLTMMGDDLYAKEDMHRAALANPDEWAVVALQVDDLGSAGKIVLDEDGRAVDIIEGADHSGGAGLLNTGLCAIDMRIFEFPMLLKSPTSSEYNLPQTMIRASVPKTLITATSWLQMTSPEDLQKAEQILAKPDNSTTQE